MFQGFTKHSGLPEDCFSGSWNIQNFWRLFQGYSKHFKTVLSCFIIVRSNIRDARCLFQGYSKHFKTVRSSLIIVRSNIRDAQCLFQGFTKHSGLPDNCFSGSWNIQNFWRLFQSYSKHLKIVRSCFRIVRINFRDAQCLFKGIMKHSGLLDNCFSGTLNIQNFWRLFQGYSKHFTTVRSFFRIVRSNIRDAQCLVHGLPNIQDFPIIVSVVPETFRTFEDCLRAIRNILKLS